MSGSALRRSSDTLVLMDTACNTLLDFAGMKISRATLTRFKAVRRLTRHLSFPSKSTVQSSIYPFSFHLNDTILDDSHDIHIPACFDDPLAFST